MSDRFLFEVKVSQSFVKIWKGRIIKESTLFSNKSTLSTKNDNNNMVLYYYYMHLLHACLFFWITCACFQLQELGPDITLYFEESIKPSKDEL